VDHDHSSSELLKPALSSDNCEPDETQNEKEAISKLMAERYDLLLLECNMPRIGGIEMCRQIRTFSSIPILMMAGRNISENSVRSLDSGADDFLRKPFQMAEVLARIRVALRRTLSNKATSDIIEAGGIRVDIERRMVSVEGRFVHLTPREFDLLVCLIAHPNISIPHRQILQEVWGSDHSSQLEALRVAISQLRRKIENDPLHPRYLVTEPWYGYRLTASQVDPNRQAENSTTCCE
jgi:two-component system KDP operon response regulator KdpE